MHYDCIALPVEHLQKIKVDAVGGGTERPECYGRATGGTGVPKLRAFNRSWLLESSSEKVPLRTF